jgi:ABC-type sugar transport system substrate-binding protein
VHCVAAPVKAPDGSARAAITVSVPAPRLDAARLVKLARQVHEAAEAASTASGWAPAAGAGRAGSAVTATAAWRAGRVRVAWSMAQLFVPAYREMYRAALDAAESSGADLLWTTAYEDERKQACDVHHLLAMQPDVLVLHPVHAAQAHGLFRAAAAAGVPALCFQRPVRTSGFTLFAGGDTFREGELQVEFVAARLNGEGNVVLIEGDPYNDNARNVAEGNRRALSRHPGLRLLADEVSSFWSRATAKEIAGELLDRNGPHGPLGSHGSRGPHGSQGAGDRTGVDAIVCANDDMAGGVAEALAERGLTGRVVLAGGDGDYEALERLRRGTQDATVFQNPALVAREAMRAAVALARGTLAPGALPRRSLVHGPVTRPIPVLDVPYALITRDNLDVLEAYWERQAAGDHLIPAAALSPAAPNAIAGTPQPESHLVPS